MGDDKQLALVAKLAGIAIIKVRQFQIEKTYDYDYIEAKKELNDLLEAQHMLVDDSFAAVASERTTLWQGFHNKTIDAATASTRLYDLKRRLELRYPKYFVAPPTADKIFEKMVRQP